MNQPQPLATLDQALAHLREDDEANIPDIELKLLAASECILEYVKAQPGQWMDSSGVYPQDSAGRYTTIPWNVNAATLVLLGILYKNRDGKSDEALSPGKLPMSVTSLIYSKRMPTLI